MFPIIAVLFFMNIAAIQALIPKLGSIRAKPATLGEVYENIENHNVDNIYFSDDLQNVYFQELKDPSVDPEYPAPYRMARSNPLVTDRLISFSEKNKVNTVFLEQAANPVRDVIQAIGQTFDFFFLPVIGLFILRSFFTFQQTMGGFPGSRRGPSGRGGIPFYSNPNEKQKTEDQLNMLKMNISL